MLAALLLALPAALASSGAVSRASSAPAFFLQDTRDGLCLAGAGFKRCAVDTLWFVSGRAPSYQLHRRPEDEVAALEDWCLAKYG